MKNLASILKKRTQAMHISQKEIAHTLHIHPKTLRSYMNGEQYPHLEHLLLLLRFFNIHPALIFESSNNTMLHTDEFILLFIYRGMNEKEKKQFEFFLTHEL